MYSDILAQTRTKFDKELLLSEVIVLKESLFRIIEGKDPFEETLNNNVRASIASYIRKDIGESDRKTYLNGLQTALEQMKEVKITLSFEPTQKVVNRLHSWLAEEVGRDTILNYEVDSTIGGGAIIISDGKYYDYTLANIFEKKIETSREIIKETLNKKNE